MGKTPLCKQNRFFGGMLGTFAQDAAAALQLRHAQPLVSGASHCPGARTEVRSNSRWPNASGQIACARQFKHCCGLKSALHPGGVDAKKCNEPKKNSFPCCLRSGSEGFHSLRLRKSRRGEPRCFDHRTSAETLCFWRFERHPRRGDARSSRDALRAALEKLGTPIQNRLAGDSGANEVAALFARQTQRKNHLQRGWSGALFWHVMRRPDGGALIRLVGPAIRRPSCASWKQTPRESEVDCLITSGLFDYVLRAANRQEPGNQNRYSHQLLEGRLRMPAHSGASDASRGVERSRQGRSVERQSQSEGGNSSVGAPLQLDHFLNVRKVMNREEFCDKAGIDPSRPYISYTAASPAAVEHEELAVEALAKAICDGVLPRYAQILLRLNPMEGGAVSPGWPRSTLLW